MDFEGQKLAEYLLVRIVLVFAAIGFLAGYLTGDFMLMVYINGAGLAVSTLAVLPSWPWFRKNPLPWLPALHPAEEVQKKK
mmetsp:Transcript_31149/g.69248  ORF Transcript_31149/g.69248 Transcript_31149/m.69248 type:complete len:81 (-) Transcript_31149:882-1124(-)|eukprot:CAMPEP_0202889636 /NCGR_PEP_ID=MMETSP1392-20130828/234_1 /ASSEMBLY_ACC=CAM_ASM_000868 /TAXON_ID=225041 /ORGANISM="Chlamydomonas chlamydogama, Strain SAG 11-48b" /LENGTH=80 /DNA_ID=CAMNT_0049573015 /DNA_START=195 /DNA_END=437 /DNA_ORIENTATION=-